MRCQPLIGAAGIVCCLAFSCVSAAEPAPSSDPLARPPSGDASPEGVPALSARYAFDFREGKFDHQQLMIVGNQLTLYAWTLLAPERGGLRITIPANQGKDKRTLGVAPALTIHGDFQITADCELVTEEAPKDPITVGGQIYLLTQKSLNGASLARAINPRGEPVYLVYWAVRDETGRRPAWREIGADLRQVKLRFRRTGDMLYFQAAEGESNEFQELAQVKFGTEPIGACHIESITNGARCKVDTRWSRIEIRAEKLERVFIPLRAAGVAR